MLCQSTCVGVRYGHLRSFLEAFLGSVESITSAPKSLAFASRRYVLRIFLQHRLLAWTRTSIGALIYPPASPPWLIDLCGRCRPRESFRRSCCRASVTVHRPLPQRF